MKVLSLATDALDIGKIMEVEQQNHFASSFTAQCQVAGHTLTVLLVGGSGINYMSANS